MIVKSSILRFLTNGVVLLLLTMIMLLVCSCLNKEVEEMNPQISDGSKTVYELSTTRYTQKQLDKIEAQASNLTYQNLNRKYPVQCVRATEWCYRVVYVGVNRQLLVLFYDNQGSPILSVYPQVTPVVSSQTLDLIKVGEVNLYDVMAIDKSGDFTIFYTGVGEPRISYHYTTDGYLYSIEYDEFGIVMDTRRELI